MTGLLSTTGRQGRTINKNWEESIGEISSVGNVALFDCYIISLTSQWGIQFKETKAVKIQDGPEKRAQGYKQIILQTFTLTVRLRHWRS